MQKDEIQQREKKRAVEAEKENLQFTAGNFALARGTCQITEKRVTWVIYTVVCL